MAEDPKSYKQRLAGYVDGYDPLALQRHAPLTLAELIAGLPDDCLSMRPQPDKWSVVEIIAHMADDEVVTTWRYRQMLECDGVSLAGFDQDLWSLLGRNAGWSALKVLELFSLLREANVRMLESLSEKEWERYGVHAERGRLTVRELASHMAAHDINHIRQIEAILGPRRCGV